MEDLKARLEATGPSQKAQSKCSSNYGLLQHLISWADDIKNIKDFRLVRDQLQGGVYAGNGETLTELQVQLVDMVMFVADAMDHGVAVELVHVAVCSGHGVDLEAVIDGHKWRIEYKLEPWDRKRGLLRCLPDPYHKAISAKGWEDALSSSSSCCTAAAAELADAAAAEQPTFIQVVTRKECMVALFDMEKRNLYWRHCDNAAVSSQVGLTCAGAGACLPACTW